MNMMSFSTISLIIFPKQNIQGKFQQMKVSHNPEMIVKWIQVEKGKTINTEKKLKNYRSRLKSCKVSKMDLFHSIKTKKIFKCKMVFQIRIDSIFKISRTFNSSKTSLQVSIEILSNRWWAMMQLSASIISIQFMKSKTNLTQWTIRNSSKRMVHPATTLLVKKKLPLILFWMLTRLKKYILRSWAWLIKEMMHSLIVTMMNNCIKAKTKIYFNSLQ